MNFAKMVDLKVMKDSGLIVRVADNGYLLEDGRKEKKVSYVCETIEEMVEKLAELLDAPLPSNINYPEKTVPVGVIIIIRVENGYTTENDGVLSVHKTFDGVINSVLGAVDISNSDSSNSDLFECLYKSYS